MKIIDRITELEAAGQNYFSLEFFPPKTEEGADALVERVSKFARAGPQFVDITWGAGGSTADRTLELSDAFQNSVGIETQMHLTCTNMPADSLKAGLKRAHDIGVQNLCCLRGDPPRGSNEWTAVENGFKYAVDLVKFVRQEYGPYFGISVAGYPEGHPDGDYQQDILHLKEKVDAGADLVLTQLFYDVDLFLQFVKDCRAAGITVPILPGIMPIQNYNAWKRMITFCKTKVPQEIFDAIEPISGNDEAVKAYGVELAVQMCQKMMQHGVHGFHFYTMNLEKTVMEILTRLNLCQSCPPHRELPWTASKAPRRREEEVRPIFWSNRPRSYLARTDSWDDFPNGRWGDLRSPAFGELSDYHLGRLNQEKAEKLLKDYGVVQTEQDVFNVFASYCRGTLPQLPWVDTLMASESGIIRDHLISINERGFLTTNSQPAVNGAPSSDPVVGWGRRDGYVYQKAYVEFFTSPERLQALQAVLAQFPSLQLFASNKKGEIVTNGSLDRTVTAVTWGVFPGREIVQPTVVDTAAFMAWKDEAFALWAGQWGNLYPAEHPSRALIAHVQNSYYLVSIVDNDFMHGSEHIFGIFDAAKPADAAASTSA